MATSDVISCLLEILSSLFSGGAFGENRISLESFLWGWFGLQGNPENRTHNFQQAKKIYNIKSAQIIICLNRIFR